MTNRTVHCMLLGVDKPKSVTFIPGNIAQDNEIQFEITPPTKTGHTKTILCKMTGTKVGDIGMALTATRDQIHIQGIAHLKATNNNTDYVKVRQVWLNRKDFDEKLLFLASKLSLIEQDTHGLIKEPAFYGPARLYTKEKGWKLIDPLLEPKLKEKPRQIIHAEIEEAKQHLWTASITARKGRFKTLPSKIEEVISQLTILQRDKK